MEEQAATLDLPALWALSIPLFSVLAGQLQLFYRLSRVGGGPGTYRLALHERYKQYRSIVTLDLIAGVVSIAVVAFVGPAGALATLFDDNIAVGALFLGAVSPFVAAGFVRGAVVQGLLKPEWLRNADGTDVTLSLAGIQVIREESVDLIIRTLWMSVRTQNAEARDRLKACMERRLSDGTVTADLLVSDVLDFFEKRRAPVPTNVEDAIASVRRRSNSDRTNTQRLEKLVTVLINTENWEPLQRLCGKDPEPVTGPSSGDHEAS